jgi:hypothetical protein
LRRNDPFSKITVRIRCLAAATEIPMAPTSLRLRASSRQARTAVPGQVQVPHPVSSSCCTHFAPPVPRRSGERPSRPPHSPRRTPRAAPSATPFACSPTASPRTAALDDAQDLATVRTCARQGSLAMGSQAPPLSAGTGARYDPRPEGELAEEPDIVAARSRGGGGASSISSDTSRQQDLRSKTESSLDGGKDDATCIA